MSEEQDAKPDGLARFEEVSKLAELDVYYTSWPAWMISPNKKLAAPVIQIYVGSTNGDVLLKGNFLLTAVVTLSKQAALNVVIELERIAQLQGFRLDMPTTKADFLEDLREAKEYIEEAISLVESNDLIKDFEMQGS